MIELKPFQERGVDFLISKHHAILADDMGLGKTVQAVRAMDAIDAQKILIVCPTSLKLSWYYTVLYESSEIRLLQIVKTGKDKIDEFADVIIISYGILVDNLYKFRQKQFDLIICDESHYLRSIEAKRTWSVLGDTGVARQAKYKWMLTGTPIENKPKDLFPVLITLFYKHIAPYAGDHDTFIRKYCGGYYRAGVMTPGKFATRKEELAQIISPFVLRRVKEEVLQDFPELTTEIIYIEPTKEALKIMAKEEKEISKGQEYFVNPFGELSKRRQELALSKIGKCVEHIETVLDLKDKLVVFAFHKKVVEELTLRLAKFKPVVLVGGMSDKQKKQAVDWFVNKEEVRVFIGNVEAAGTGIDGLQKVCDTEIFVEFDLRPGKIDQAIDRLHRMLQKNAVVAQFLVIENSWEARKIKDILNKSKDNNKIIRSVEK